MSTKNRNTTRRRTPRSTAQLKAKLEVAEMVISVLTWAHPNPYKVLTRSQNLRIGDVRAKTGLPMETIVRRAVGTWLDIEAPVYMSRRYDA